MNIHDVKRFTEYLCRLDSNVDANGFYFLVLVWKQDIESNNLLKKKQKKIIDKEQLEYLIETAKYIDWANTDSKPLNKVSITDFIVTEHFLKLIAIDMRTAFKELYESYPKHVQIENRKVNARNLNFDEGEVIYDKAINGDRLLHFKIIEIVKEYNKIFNGIAPKSLKNFIKLQEWDYWQEILKDLHSSSNLDSQDLGEILNEDIVNPPDSI